MCEATMRGALCLEDDAASAVQRFIESRRAPDGGFMGRDHASDLYYTVFGIACLQALSADSFPGSLSAYLAGFRDGRDLDFVHLTCLLRCLAHTDGFAASSRQESILSRIERYRSGDGGYNHASRHADCGSAYAAFLALIAYQDAGRTPPDPDGILESLGNLRSVDGGYANEPGTESGTTTATAAAAAVQACLDAPVPAGVARWILAQSDEQGGFRGTPQAPAPDLLSTASALFALTAMGVSRREVTDATSDYVALLWHDSGGFLGHLFDTAADCEYTFYALLALGCLEP